MKKSLTLLARLCCLYGCLATTVTVSAQLLDESLYDYGDYKGKYYVRTQVHFVETTTNQWLGNFTPAQLQHRADGIMENLNRAYNKHGIYLVSADGTCAKGAAYNAISHPGTTYNPSNLDNQVIDIFDFGNSPASNCAPPANTICGTAGGTPSRYFWLHGSYFDPVAGVTVPTGHTPVAIHEMGHALGLLHTYRGVGNDVTGCDDMLGPCPQNAPPGTALCFCCGDQVCDTPPTPSPLDFGTDCSHPNLNEDQIRNYMNGAFSNESILCLDRFSPGQVRRMKAYLELSATLSSVQLNNGTPYAGNLPAGIYSDILVKSGTILSIYSPVEMLPGASIKVEKGARLNVFSTITGACGQMWQGVVVAGDDALPQNAQNQGRVVMNPDGKIEHARCAISLQDLNPDGSPKPGTGGGYAWLLGGNLENNLVGLRFGPYVYPSSSNANMIKGPKFLVTDEIRDDAQTPVFIRATNNARLTVSGSTFRDLRSGCHLSIDNESDRAWGIVLLNAGMSVWHCTFENLETGIWADEIFLSRGSLFLKSNTFNNCYTSVLSHSTGSFSIRDNDFFVKKPEACPDSYRRVTGIQIQGNTPGFTLKDNHFFSDDSSFSDDETLTGINARATGAGMNNVIFKNKFTNLNIGNRAEGVNANDEFGLLYLCNTNIDCYDDFIVTAAGTIQQEQKDRKPGTLDDWPTGNVFSDLVNSFNNLGPKTVQYYYTDKPGQEPTIGIVGIELNFINEPNGNCADPPPCPPPCDVEFIVIDRKQQFYEDKQAWATRVANLSALTDSLQIVAAKDTISRYRARMDNNANLVLQQFSLDTTTVFETDSLVHWLTLTETYPAALRLARHYFFSQDLTAFDTLWSQIPAKYGLTDHQSEEFNELGYVYDLVRPYLSSEEASLYVLPGSVLDSLKIWGDWCSEPGFLAQSLLFRNGIYFKSDCSAGPGERSSEEARGTTTLVVQAAFKVYPNPATQTLHIEAVKDFEDGMLKMVDFQGRVILSRVLPEGGVFYSLDISEVPPGIYFLHIHQSRSACVKIIVTR